MYIIIEFCFDIVEFKEQKIIYQYFDNMSIDHH
jgi:hypothetical protein